MGEDPVTCAANNGLSDPRSVSVTSVIWSECEPVLFSLLRSRSDHIEIRRGVRIGKCVVRAGQTNEAGVGHFIALSHLCAGWRVAQNLKVSSSKLCRMFALY